MYRRQFHSRPSDPLSFASFGGVQLHSFEPVSMKSISELIMKFPDKICGLDPMPTPLMKQCLLELAEVSLPSGIVPDAF